MACVKYSRNKYQDESNDRNMRHLGRTHVKYATFEHAINGKIGFKKPGPLFS